MERLLRKGMPNGRGLDSIRAQARKRRRELRKNNRLDGTLEQVRELLEQALTAERSALFPDPSDAARMAEAELENLPQDTARAVRELNEYQWRSPAAAQAFQQIQDLLRSEVLDAQFAGMKDAMANATPEDLARIRKMMSALNDMLDADARGEHTSEQFAEFMESYGDFFPDQPENLAELVDSLARRSAAAQRLMNSLSPQQRAELGQLMADMMGADGLAEQMGRLQAGLRSARPDLSWTGREQMDGDQPMATPTAPVRCPSWPTSTSSNRWPTRTTPARRSAISTMSWSNARSDARPLRTWRSCAGSSRSYSARGTWIVRPAKGFSSLRVRCVVSARPR